MTTKPIKISIPEDMFKIIDGKAKKLGLKPTTFCTNLIFEYVRKEIDK